MLRLGGQTAATQIKLPFQIQGPETGRALDHGLRQTAPSSQAFLFAVLGFGAGLSRMRTPLPSDRSTSKPPVF